MEGKILLSSLDIYNILQQTLNVVGSQEEYDIYKKACDTWWNKQAVLQEKEVLTLQIEYSKITINKQGKIIIRQ